MRATRFVVVLNIGLSLLACGGDDDEKTKTFALGALVGLTGNNADIAYGETVQLAAAQLNEALAKEGENYRIKLVLQDSQAVPTVAMERALDIIKNQDVRMVVFDTSQDVVVAAQSYYDSDPSNDLGVVLMDGLGSGAAIIKPAGTPGAQPWQLDADNWIWRTVMSSTVSAYGAIDVLATYTPAGHIPGDVNGDGVVKVAMFGTNDGLGVPSLADASVRAKALFGASTVVEQAYHEAGLSVDDTAQWTGFVSKLLDANDDILTAGPGSAVQTTPGHVPDMIFTGLQVLYNVPTYKAFKASNVDIPYMGGLAMRSGVFLTQLGALAEGAQSVGAPANAPTPSGQQFKDDFAAATGGTNGQVILYDAMITSGLSIIIAANATGNIDTVGNDDIKAAIPQTSTAGGVEVISGVDGLRAAIRAVKAGQPFNYSGASGPCDFDAYGDVRSYIARHVVQNGAWTTPEIYDCTQSLTECIRQ